MEIVATPHRRLIGELHTIARSNDLSKVRSKVITEAAKLVGEINPRFRYYVTNRNAGRVDGTNSVRKAQAFARTENYFVVDAITGLWLQSEKVRIPVTNLDTKS